MELTKPCPNERPKKCSGTMTLVIETPREPLQPPHRWECPLCKYWEATYDSGGEEA